MRDTKRYQVAEVPHSIDHRVPDIIGRRAAFARAMELGDRIAIWEYDGRRQHWELILDRTVPQAGQLPKRAHLRNVLRVVELVHQRTEVGTGAPGYRWATRYLVPSFPAGGLLYPACTRSEAYALAREQFGADAIVIAP